MPKTVFTAEHVEAWWDLFEKERPTALTETEWPDLPQVESFRCTVLSAGIAVRFRTHDGKDIAFLMNPVAARHFANTIAHQGMEAGWLDREGEIAFPPLILDS